MRPEEHDPVLGLEPEKSQRRLMLAVTGRLKRPRVVRGGPDFERWARAWARRWWVVLADTADLARDAIARYDEKCARVGLGTPVDAAQFGIIEAGRNAAGPISSPRPDWERGLFGQPRRRIHQHTR